jgi:hypothetical protein
MWRICFCKCIFKDVRTYKGCLRIDFIFLPFKFLSFLPFLIYFTAYFTMLYCSNSATVRIHRKWRHLTCYWSDEKRAKMIK